MAKVFNHIYGIASLLGFIFSLVGMVFFFKNQDNPESIILLYFSITSGMFCFSFLFLIAYYSKQLDKHFVKLCDYERLYTKHQSLEELSIEGMNLFHFISHYVRNVCNELDTLLSKESPTSEDINTCLRAFEKFLTNTLAYTKSYFDLMTNSKNACCLKLLKDRKAKTLLRDPISFKERKRNDVDLSTKENKLYDVDNNTAFKTICDSNKMQSWYICDDCHQRHKNGEYANTNPNWDKLYKAVAVFPISKLQPNDTRKILGFICVDNKNGNLASEVTKETLGAIGDALYTVFERIDVLVPKIGEGNSPYVKKFRDWSSC
jgi:hypothetical protein